MSALPTTVGAINPNPRTSAEHIFNWQRLSTALFFNDDGGLIVPQTMNFLTPSWLIATGTPGVVGELDSSGQFGTLTLSMATQNAYTALLSGTNNGSTPTFGVLKAGHLDSGFAAGYVLTANANNTMSWQPIGAFLSASQPSTVTLSNGVAATVISLSLPAGDWDVWGIVDYSLSAATTSHFASGIGLVNNTLPLPDNYADLILNTSLTTDVQGHLTPVVRMVLAATTTVYLIARCAFAGGGVEAYGTIRARRAA